MLSSPLHSGSLFHLSIKWTQQEPLPHLDAISAPYHLHQSPSQAIGSMISISYLQQLHSLRQICLRSPLQEGERGREKEHHGAHIRPAASTVTECRPATEFPKTTQKSLTISESRLWLRRLVHIHPTALRSLIDGYSKDDSMCIVCIQARPSRRSSKSKPSTLQSHLNTYIRMCVDHSPHLPPPAIATISYSSTITHATPLFGFSQIRTRNHAPQPTIQIYEKWRKTRDIY